MSGKLTVGAHSMPIPNSHAATLEMRVASSTSIADQTKALTHPEFWLGCTRAYPVRADSHHM